jgi:hypothetical protein
LEDGFHP